LRGLGARKKKVEDQKTCPKGTNRDSYRVCREATHVGGERKEEALEGGCGTRGKMSEGGGEALEGRVEMPEGGVEGGGETSEGGAKGGGEMAERRIKTAEGGVETAEGGGRGRAPELW
jgi:hypothetical protein